MARCKQLFGVAMSHPTNIVLILYSIDEVKDEVEVKDVDVDDDVADEVDDGIIDIDDKLDDEADDEIIEDEVQVEDGIKVEVEVEGEIKDEIKDDVEDKIKDEIKEETEDKINGQRACVQALGEGDGNAAFAIQYSEYLREKCKEINCVKSNHL